MPSVQCPRSAKEAGQSQPHNAVQNSVRRPACESAVPQAVIRTKVCSRVYKTALTTQEMMNARADTAHMDTTQHYRKHKPHNCCFVLYALYASSGVLTQKRLVQMRRLHISTLACAKH